MAGQAGAHAGLARSAGLITVARPESDRTRPKLAREKHEFFEPRINAKGQTYSPSNMSIWSISAAPRVVRHGYREDGDWSRYTEKFKAYLDTQETTLARLWDLMPDERCCLMCFEADFNFCHRSFVAERMLTLADGPMRVLHLTGPMAGRVVESKPVPVLAGR